MNTVNKDFDKIIIRNAIESDLPQIAKMGSKLASMHHDVDPARFFLPGGVEEGYRQWFKTEFSCDKAVIIIAALGESVVGYIYGTIEESNWNALLGKHGAIHDIFVDKSARQSGIGYKLVNAMTEELNRRGAPSIVLSTMVSNKSAQELFKSCGFQPTMIEMTKS